MTGLPTWGSGQPGQVGNQAALTVEPVLGLRLVNFIFESFFIYKKLSSFPYLLSTPNFCHQQLSVNFALGIHFSHGWAFVHGFEVVAGR